MASELFFCRTHYQPNKALQKMINNYLEHQYHPSHKVYTHSASGYSIFLGDIQAALDLSFIQQQRILTVVTAAAAMDHVAFEQPVQHIVYPLLDMKSENICKFFGQFYDLVQRQIVKGNILVHCAAGISRSSTLVIAYLMKKHEWGFRQAIAFLRKARPAVCPNLGFERQLKDYEINQKKIRHQHPLDRRTGSKTSQERKHISSPDKPKILPEISAMGRTSLKPKTLDLLAPEQERQSSQRSRNSTEERNRHQLQFYGTRRMTFKPLKSRSIAERAPLLISNIMTQQNSLNKLKGSLPIERINQVLVQRLNLNDKKISTERQLRIKPLHKLAYY